MKAWILELPGVTGAPHRFGGTEFQVDGLEFMHSHGTSFLDIRLSKQDQSAALKEGRAIPHQFAPQAGWVSFRIEEPEDVEKAKQIISQAYEHAKAAMAAHKSRLEQSKLK